jgi:hypothetical protein
MLLQPIQEFIIICNSILFLLHNTMRYHAINPAAKRVGAIEDLDSTGLYKIAGGYNNGSIP